MRTLINSLNRKTRIFLSLFFFIVFNFCVCLSTSLALDDAIIGVVNDELITFKDLNDYLRATYASLVAEGREDEEIKEIMKDLQDNGIDRLIEDKLILSRANELKLEVREKLVDERLEKIKGQYPSEQIFLGALTKNGVTITELRKKIRDQLKIDFVVEEEVKSKIYVNPQEVTEFYQQNQGQFMKKESLKLDSIFIDAKEDKDQAKIKAQEALELIKQGQDFSAVALRYSQTPSLGLVERGQLLPSIEEVVFNLQQNEVSALVEVEGGLYIFKLMEKISGQMASLAEVKNSIYDFLFKKKFQDRLVPWMEKLKKNAYIDIKE